MGSSKTLRPAAQMLLLSASSPICGLNSSLRLKAAIGQGVDLGRPSLLRAVAEKVDGVVTKTFIGGGCKPLMSGWIDLQ